MTPQPEDSGLATSEESQEPLVPDQSEHHPEGALALHLVVQLDPGEGRDEGHRHTGGTAGARTSCTDKDRSGFDRPRQYNTNGRGNVRIWGVDLGEKD